MTARVFLVSTGPPRAKLGNPGGNLQVCGGDGLGWIAGRRRISRPRVVRTGPGVASMRGPVAKLDFGPGGKLVA